MSFEVRDLEARLVRVERENRRLKRAGVISAGVLGLLALAGAAAPVCDVLYGERLVLRDERGKSRVTIDAYHIDQPAISFQDRDGRTLAKLGVDKSGDAFLATYDAKGATRGQWTFTPDNATKPEPKPAGEKKNDPAMADD